MSIILNSFRATVAVDKYTAERLSQYIANLTDRRVDLLEDGSFSLKIGKTNRIAAVYRLEEKNGDHFLSVMSKANRSMGGKRYRPVLIDGKTELETWGVMFRKPFLDVGKWKSKIPFGWPPEYVERINDGDMTLRNLNLRWSSADLGPSRDTVLQYLRRLYAGQVGNTTETLSSFINITSTAFDNGMGNYNLCLKAKYGKDKSFSLGLHAKDKKSTDKRDVTEVGTPSRIRFDCALFGTYLKAIKASSVSDLERLFQLKCEDGDDLGFYKWLTEKIYDRIKLIAFLKVDIELFDEDVEKIEKLLSKEKNNVKYRMLKAWMGGEKFSSFQSWADLCGVSRQHVHVTAKEFNDEYSLDFFIPYRMYLHAHFNLLLAGMSDDDVRDVLRQSSNSFIEKSELRKLSKKVSHEVDEKLTLGNGFRLASLKPTIVMVNK